MMPLIHLVVTHFTCPCISWDHFHYSLQLVVLKHEICLLCLSRLMWKSHSKVTHITKLSKLLSTFYCLSLLWWLECSPIVWETWVQSQFESYQRHKKWYLMSPCLTLSIIRYGSRVKWVNHGKGVVPSPTPWCCSYWKRSLWLTLDYGHQLYL